MEIFEENQDLNNLKKRRHGRYRMSPEDRAKSVPIKLHKEHIEKLKIVKGDNNSQRIRFLLDNYARFSLRESRQIKEIRKRLSPLVELSKNLYNPELKNDPEKYKKVRNSFLKAFENFSIIIDLFHFEISDLNEHLSEEEIKDLEIIFIIKGSLG